jgi:signal transduction histidine kinase
VVTIGLRVSLPAVAAACYASLLWMNHRTLSTLPFLAVGMLLLYPVVTLYEWVLTWSRHARDPAINEVSLIHAAVLHRALSNPLHALQALARGRPAESIEGRLADLRVLLDRCTSEIERNRAEPTTVRVIVDELAGALMIEDANRIQLVVSEIPEVLSSLDTQLLRCVLADLCCNALKEVRGQHFPTASVTVRRTALAGHRQSITVEVADDGPGVAAVAVESTRNSSIQRLDRILATFGGGLQVGPGRHGGALAVAKWTSARLAT